MTAEIVFVGPRREPYTTSLVVADETDNEHRSVLQLIRNNLADFNEVGRVAFEMRPFDTAGGVQRRDIALLDEPAATLLVTYLRNNEKVRGFKKRLVRGFYAMRQVLLDQAAVQPAIPQTYAQALRAAADEAERADRAEAERDLALERAESIQPSADAWDRLSELGADYEVDVAAKILSRDSSINIGRNRLYVFMHDQDWVFRGRHNTWKAYQDQVDLERLKMRPGDEFYDKERQQYRMSDPTILITPKGLAELRRLLGRAGGQLELVTA